ncbi:MAG: CrcB family protein [Kurthia sp.]|nr:CrcB family protein [Candidatus Kurthia equi]
MSFFIVFVGGAIGALLRYFVILLFPSGVVLWMVNGLGSFLMGCLQGYFSGKDFPKWKLFLTTGILGAFTTFSAFSAEWFELMNTSFFSGLLYLLGMTLFCVVLASFGHLLFLENKERLS